MKNLLHVIGIINFIVAGIILFASLLLSQEIVSTSIYSFSYKTITNPNTIWMGIGATFNFVVIGIVCLALENILTNQDSLSALIKKLNVEPDNKP